MRWVGFAIVAVAGIVLQTTLAPLFAVGGVRPDWVLVLVVFFAMHGKGLDAVLAGWVLGLLADFQTAEKFGLLSLAYGLTALVVYLLRDLVFRRHPLAHFAVTLLAGLLLQAVMFGYVAVRHRGAIAGWTDCVTGGLSALYTALWAPPLHALLLRAARWLGLEIVRSGPGRARRV